MMWRRMVATGTRIEVWGGGVVFDRKGGFSGRVFRFGMIFLGYGIYSNTGYVVDEGRKREDDIQFFFIFSKREEGVR